MSGGDVYHGYYASGGAAVSVESADGQLLGVLAHLPRHSPAGFGWGYGGSGPADLARSLLIAAAGEDARCPYCAGVGRIEYLPDNTWRPAATDSDPEAVIPCVECDEGSLVSPSIYQQFKWEIVAKLGRDWRLSVVEVRAWWAAHRP